MPVFCLLLNFPDNAFIGRVRKGIWKHAQSSLRNGRSGGNCRRKAQAYCCKLQNRKKKSGGEKKDWIALGNNKWISSTTPRDLESTTACALEHESLQNICKKLIILRIIHTLFWGQPPPPKPQLCSWVFNPRWRRRFSSRQNQLRHLRSCSIIRKARERLFVLCELLPFFNFHFRPQLINFNHAKRFVAHSV